MPMHLAKDPMMAGESSLSQVDRLSPHIRGHRTNSWRELSFSGGQALAPHRGAQDYCHQQDGGRRYRVAEMSWSMSVL